MENQLNDDFSIAQRIEFITDSIDRACAQAGRPRKEIQLMAVTKTVESSRVNEAIAAGVRLLGENKAQELLRKYDDYQKEGVDIHFIGHLQSNKVRQIIDKVTMIQSLDSFSLAQELQRQCERLEKTIDCLVEVNIGSELTKAGIVPDKVVDFMGSVSNFNRLRIRGIMSIPPASDQEQEKERNFSSLYKLFVDIKAKKIDNISMDVLSMGMSDDYLMAIKHGSNLVRLGTVIFGRRNYF